MYYIVIMVVYLGSKKYFSSGSVRTPAENDKSKKGMMCVTLCFAPSCYINGQNMWARGRGVAYHATKALKHFSDADNG
jgi:hypothetical protein